MKRLILILAATTALAACASEPGEEPAVTRGRVNVFISPMGEPFRAGAEDPYPVDVWFNRVDANHDGALTLDEFQADAELFFKRLDVNHDGVIDGAELSAYEQTVAPEILPRIARLTAKDLPPLPSSDPDARRRQQIEDEAASGQETRPRAGLLAGAAVFGVTPEPEPVAASDSDFDGKITLAEWRAAARRRFDLLDVNHDGRILRSELPKTPAEKLADKAARRERQQQQSSSARPSGG